MPGLLRSSDGTYALRFTLVECALAPLPLPSVALVVTHDGPLGTVAQRAWIEDVDLKALASSLASGTGTVRLRGFSPGEFELDLDVGAHEVAVLLGHRRSGGQGTEAFRAAWRVDSFASLSDWASRWSRPGALESLAASGGAEDEADDA